MIFHKEKDLDKTIYTVKSQTGHGMMTSYTVFPGIELIYNDFHDFACFESDSSRSDLIEINHCLKGRFECEFKNNKMIYIGEGDFAVNPYSNQIHQASFPLGFYQGITVLIDMPKAAGIVNELLDDISIDLYMLRQKLCTGGDCFYLRSNQTIDHIFSELYDVDSEIQKGYFKIKVLELLLFLGSQKIVSAGEPKKYYDKALVDIVKQAQKYLTENLSEHITIEALVSRFSVGRTLFLNCFKEVYGLPIYAYMKEYRMNAAAVLLSQSSQDIAVIADCFGYQSASKFAQAFREVFGVLPSEYRKTKGHYPFRNI